MTSRVVILAIAATGCMLDYEPDVGEALNIPDDAGEGVVPGCDNSDTNPGVTVSFAADVQPLMTRSPGGCMPCHLGRATAGFDMGSYQALRRGGINSGPRIVVASEPCNSILLQKIGRTPPFGSRMPLGGPPYFSAEEQLLVRDWIAEGGANN
jgi:hypothetical protein